MSYVAPQEMITRRDISQDYLSLIAWLVEEAEQAVNNFCWVESFSSWSVTEYISKRDVVVKWQRFHLFQSTPNPSSLSIDWTAVSENIIYDTWFIRVKNLFDYYTSWEEYIKLEYTGGFSPIPKAVKQAVIKYVQDEFASARPWVLQSNVQSYRLADEQITYRNWQAENKGRQDYLSGYKRVHVLI